MQEKRYSWRERPEELPSVIDSIKRQHSGRLLMNKLLLRLYFQIPMLPDGGDEIWREYGAFPVLQQLGFNTVRKVIDAARSRICRPLRPVVMPVAADYEVERTCTELSRCVDGVMDMAAYWKFHGPQVFADAFRTTIGHIEWYMDPRTKEIKCERCDPLSVFWHRDEGRNPAHLYQEIPGSVELLCAQFPQHETAIRGLSSWSPRMVVGAEYSMSGGSDSVRVCKGWRRDLGDGKGRYVVTAGPIVLVNEPYEYDFFPLVACRWDQDFRSYDGVAGASVIAPYQRWKNCLVNTVHESLRGAVPFVSMHEDENFPDVSDLPFQKFRWSMHEPKITVNNPVSTQVLQWVDKLDDEAHAEFGMNAQAAEGTLPPGLTSAPGQRERIALIDSRLSRLQDAWENLATDSARVIVALASKYYKNTSVRVRAPGTEMFESIKWPINLKEKQYNITFSKTSGLSSTTWGKKQEAGELRDRGDITEGEYLRMIELPDIKATADRINSFQDRASDIVCKALDEMKFETPDPMMGQEGLDAIVRFGTQQYMLAVRKGGYPDENLECLRREIQAAVAVRDGITSKPSPVLPVPAVLPGQPAGVAPMPSSVLPSLNGPPAPGPEPAAVQPPPLPTP